MDTSKLRKFAQFARRNLIDEVSVKLDIVLQNGSSARREFPQTIKKLEENIRQHDKDWVIERVAYIWFNRFCALRFMDVNRYNRIGIVSPAEGQFQPEILAEAKMGHIDEEMIPGKTRKKVVSLLNESSPSRDPQGEAYRLLVVGACNDWSRSMPFLFEEIDDYTELLMPDDLLSGKSILAYTRETLTPEACRDVEVIGWLYQFYISEKKDEVFEELKKNKKITPENIPAATQLFTPHWIVRYLVENSLGRLWMLNHPNSRLIEQMEYYIKPEQAETDYLRISRPEEIKVCDPACGSGHMLTYTFDLLYAIYEEEGYESPDIPERILTHNLYGIEIDERAGELAAFALTMKARARYNRFFRKPVQPNICVLENIQFDDNELKDYMDFIGRDLFTSTLHETLTQFEESNNFGSLIRPRMTNIDGMLTVLESKSVSGDLLLYAAHQKVLQALKQANYLSSKYHVVIANPPYMGRNGMNSRLNTWAKDYYPKSKSDLFAMFIERNLELAQKQGEVAMITMQSWMFLSSFETLRARILDQDTILSMAHLGARAFDTIGGEVVSTTAFVLENAHHPKYKGSYLRLVDGNSEAEKEAAILGAIGDPDCSYFYRVPSFSFNSIPGCPIAYWISEKVYNVITNCRKLNEAGIHPATGFQTGDNDVFIRRWQEVSKESVSIKWFPVNNGGDKRKWYGNFTSYVDWENDGSRIKKHKSSVIRNPQFYFKEGATWNRIAGSNMTLRYMPAGYLFDQAGDSLFFNEGDILYVISFMNTIISSKLMVVLSTPFNLTAGSIANFPFLEAGKAYQLVSQRAKKMVDLAKLDWDSFETSWDFTGLPLLYPDFRQLSLESTYRELRANWQAMTLEMQRLEEENNRIFIDAYGLQDEMTPEVPLSEITLTCNPHYRYGDHHSEDELDALLLADTMREFMFYAVGCMFGRYALEKPGLILANQGETFADYVKRVQDPSFPADEDNVIPILDGDWFIDDISERFRKFLRVTFGEKQFEENLKFIENAIGNDIRRYFLRDFYNDHVKRYMKRPIYWLFSSPKGSFNALIYMHRYNPDTVSIILNDYLRGFRAKLASHLGDLNRIEASANATKADKVKAIKEIEDVKKKIDELDAWERDILYPLATRQIEIDLDDGVKVNYGKFTGALKKIPGLEAKED